ncbi:hypothetical protein AAFF_G00288450 [Aldrovandia affinis]|uniref:Uncharacterized protein n=1 Tax=Aldrovandia affinis TaxID=143900 RepID=A0AAD7SQQ6_9TELE|nr:hypothetical protein AAFF_G00288450 [Aldrovandia affinis]
MSIKGYRGNLETLKPGPSTGVQSHVPLIGAVWKGKAVLVVSDVQKRSRMTTLVSQSPGTELVRVACAVFQRAWRGGLL